MGTEGADKHCGSTAASEQKDMELKEHKLPNDFPKGRMPAMLLQVAAGLLVHAQCRRQHSTLDTSAKCCACQLVFCNSCRAACLGC
jgi:hypothetical protein